MRWPWGLPVAPFLGISGRQLNWVLCFVCGCRLEASRRVPYLRWHLERSQSSRRGLMPTIWSFGGSCIQSIPEECRCESETESMCKSAHAFALARACTCAHGHARTFVQNTRLPRARVHTYHVHENALASAYAGST